MDHQSKTKGATLVTGGASGIGLATVELLWRRGQRVVVADANARAIDALRDRADLPLDLACLMPCDVTDEAEVERMFERAQARFGRIAGLVQSAGIGAEIPFLDTPTRTFRQVLEVNLVGAFVVARTAARRMAAQGGGAIVNIASASGLVGNAGRSAYGASKGGLVTLTKVMAVELAEAAIRVNAVAPGAIETPLVATMHSPATRASLLERIPQRRYGTPHQVASVIATLLDDELSGYCTGQVIAIDGGMTAAGLLAAARLREASEAS
ncbi:NAD(P)-dependent dehydrogenase, short-chain alcohol dehydrogenase family [Variovorax sp. PDC80]|uniref:SDR family NAD(P)-dependent oxidoreductase n=1 Tax=Variovorax sp. PDC80 TaxID=1882827 RepID=UPI0008E3297E|nr:SDR family oxidoreductase [Variovorax sp. PDC80]SFO76996.1 NAD(P)-dependent dehydrogenase, short-chain alcohol dehydrogenase family [Variovorax sp. PDC80]